MRIGAYQFRVTGNIEENRKIILKAISEAVSQKLDLLVFPECALTGYPPYDIPNSAEVDFHHITVCLEELQIISSEKKLCIVLGTILKEMEKIYNSAIAFVPDRKPFVYSKRALWGYDKDNFSSGHSGGVFQLSDRKIGLRICFEVRFPEYFRELYRENTDLNIILFYDISKQEDPQRYELIRSHIRTRAVENVCPILTVNTSASFQTAPTALFGRSGQVLLELERDKKGLLQYDLDFPPLDFGEQGRKEISDMLISDV